MNPPRAGFFMPGENPMLQFKGPNVLNYLPDSHPAYSPGSRPDQSLDRQFPGMPSLLPALGRQLKAASSAPQRLVSGLYRGVDLPIGHKDFLLPALTGR